MYWTYEKLELSSTPTDEPCAQVGTDDYTTIAKAECRAFIHQLIRQFGEHESAYFAITRNPHDFGTYYEVAVKYDSDDKTACDYAYNVETNLPDHWDSAAKAELRTGTAARL